MTSDDRAKRSALRAAARAAAVSPKLLAAARSAEAGEAPDPRPGDLWRVGWADRSALVIALRVSAHTVVAVPVTIDPATGDDQALCLQPGDTVLNMRCAAWAGLATTLPLSVLDAFLDHLDPGLRSALDDLTAASPPSSTHQTGEELVSPFDPVASHRAELEDLMHDLAAVRWTPVAETTATTLRAILGADALPELPDLLDIGTAEAWELWRGAPLSTDQAALVAGRFGVDATDLMHDPVTDEGLVIELDHPRWRTRLRALKHTRGLDDVAVRRTVAAGVAVMAARQTGRADTQWRARLQHFFDHQQA